MLGITSINDSFESLLKSPVRIPKKGAGVGKKPRKLNINLIIINKNSKDNYEEQHSQLLCCGDHKYSSMK